MSNLTPMPQGLNIRVIPLSGNRAKLSFWNIVNGNIQGIPEEKAIPPEIATALLDIINTVKPPPEPKVLDLTVLKNLRLEHNCHGGLTLKGDMGGGTTYNKHLSHIASGEIKAIFEDLNQVFDAIKK